MAQKYANLVSLYEGKKFEYEQFLAGIEVFFKKNPALNESPLPTVHSIKSRLKDPSHLDEKIQRKIDNGRSITEDNIFTEITDLIGVRVLHLHQEQFAKIHTEIMKKVNSGDWHLFEPPMAYTWDPESVEFYKELDLETKVRETYYTSIHYVIQPNSHNPITCEIQVRTLFEEIWGEIDHTINYPKKTDSIGCKEQLRVLSKLVSTGTRLADSIMKTAGEFKQLKSL